jgi:hypothetical protein
MLLAVVLLLLEHVNYHFSRCSHCSRMPLLLHLGARALEIAYSSFSKLIELVALRYHHLDEFRPEYIRNHHHHLPW